MMCAFFIIKSMRKRRHRLPETIFERIAVAAISIQQHFILYKLSNSKEDKTLWNNISFIIAFLIEYRICTVVDQIRIQLGFKNLYKDKDETFACEVWIKEGVSFYRKQIRKMNTGSYTLPDIIVYNLMNQSLEKATFENTFNFNINILMVSKSWIYILHILETFFLNDKNLKNVPLGC